MTLMHFAVVRKVDMIGGGKSGLRNNAKGVRRRLDDGGEGGMKSGYG
jgi:hypothetical protein